MRRRLLALLWLPCAACGYEGVTGPVPENVGSLILEAGTSRFTVVGDSATLSARLVRLEDEIVVPPEDLLYSSADPHVVQVDQHGTVRAQGIGTGTIAASNGIDSADLTFEVLPEGPHGPAILGEEVHCTDGAVGPFPCRDVTLLSYLPHGALGIMPGIRLNDMWGWTDPATGREYVLVGRADGVTFVDLGDPLHPRVLGELPTASVQSTWRDIKVHEDHALVVSDANPGHGMQIFDLRLLRSVSSFTRFSTHARYEEFGDAHNLAVNEATGFAYAVGGETCGGGFHMIDISNLRDPAFAGCYRAPGTGRFSDGYTHDLQCIVYDGPDQDYAGREICIAANETHLVVADVTDKADPATISIATYPGAAYVHQGWLTEDRRYFLQNDELDEGPTRTMIWDVTDLDDPIKIAEHVGASDATDHNLFVRGDLAYLSNYTAGLHILDISDPLAPAEVAFLDTVPGNDDPGFLGSWANYPYFESGIIVTSSAEEGLFVLKLNGGD